MVIIYKMRMILLLLFYTKCGFSQVIDTIYFTKEWHISDSKDFSYYRIAEKNGSKINIYDYYQNDKLQYTGTIEKDIDQIYKDNIKAIGLETFYDKKGRKNYSRDREVLKYFEQIPDINTEKYLNDSLINLSFEIFYYKNGKIKSQGFLIDDCKKHIRWWYYDKKGRLFGAYDYQYGELEGRYEWYNNGKISVRYTYKNGIKHGEYKEYNFDNILVEEGFYENGKKQGESRKYDWVEGYLKTIILYDNGKKISETKKEK